MGTRLVIIAVVAMGSFDDDEDVEQGGAPFQGVLVED
jgi:hypothetical protein